MQKKRIIGVISVLIVIVVGLRLYRKFDTEQKRKEVQKANQELYLKVQKQQEELQYNAQLAAAQAKRDSAFQEEKKLREAQLEQMRATIKKLENEEKNQQ